MGQDFWLFFQLALEAPLICFNLSVLFCILRQIVKKDCRFRNGFFIIYAMQSAADIVTILLAVLFVRFPRIGVFVDVVALFPLGNIGFFVLTYANTFQLVAHAAIAINRYDVIARKPGKAWRGKHLCVVVAIILVLPLPSSSTRIVSRVMAVQSGPDVYALVYADARVYTIAAVVAFCYGLFTSIVSILFELKTLVAYRRLTMQSRLRYRHDFLLLIYASMQLIVQLMWSAYYALIMFGQMTGSLNLTATVQSTNAYLLDGLCLSGPICLLSTSKLLRSAYKRMYACSRPTIVNTSSGAAHQKSASVFTRIAGK